MNNLLFDPIIFSGVVVAILCSLLIFSKNKNRSSDQYLVVWLSLTTVNLLYYLYSGFLPQIIQSVGFTLPTLSVSILYLYIFSLTFDIEFKAWYIIRHSVFYALYNLIFLLISLFYQEIRFQNSLPYLTGKNGIILNLLTLPMAVVPIIYIVLCFAALKKYQKILPDLYSSFEKINLNWLKYILLSLIGLFVTIVVIFSVATRWHYFPVDNISKIIGTVQTLYLLCIVFFSLRQSIIYGQDTGIKDNTKKEEEVVQLDERSKMLSARLLDYMPVEKPYLDEELSLLKLSLLLNISTNQLSQVINQNLNTSFYQFVNSYRVEEVKQKLTNREFDHYSILGIAFESGFNSKSTFNKIFKEETGMTPSQYKSSNHNL